VSLEKKLVVAISASKLKKKKGVQTSLIDVCVYAHTSFNPLSLAVFPSVIPPSTSLLSLFLSPLYFSAEFFSFKRQNLPPAIALESVDSFSYL